MKTCKKCLREYDEQIPVDDDPARELGEIFLETTKQEGEKDLCPDCRQETGILNLLGFGQ